VKPRTIEELNALLDQDLVWRRKEIAIFSGLVQSTNGASVGVIVRAGVALVYAHWEGFVKHCAQSYVRYVGVRKLSTDQLATPFVGQALKKEIEKLGSKLDSDNLNALIDSIFRNPSETCPIPFKDEVQTRSNLNSDVLFEIVQSLGLDFQHFESKANLVDEKLVGQRNSIAHGRYIDVSSSHFLSLKDEVLGLMTLFKNLVENAVVSGQYMITAKECD